MTTTRKFLLAYCRDNRNVAEQLMQDLQRVEIDFHPVICDNLTHEETLPQIIKAHYLPVILIVSDNFLRSSTAMHEALSLLQDTNLHDRLFLVIADGRHKDPLTRVYSSVPTQFRTVSHVIAYMNYWQDQFLDFRKKKNITLEENMDTFNRDLAVYKAVSSEVGEFLRLLRESKYYTLEQLQAEGYKSFFKKTGNSTLHKEYLALAPAIIPAVVMNPNQTPTAAPAPVLDDNPNEVNVPPTDLKNGFQKEAELNKPEVVIDDVKKDDDNLIDEILNDEKPDPIIDKPIVDETNQPSIDDLIKEPNEEEIIADVDTPEPTENPVELHEQEEIIDTPNKEEVVNEVIDETPVEEVIEAENIEEIVEENDEIEAILGGTPSVKENVHEAILEVEEIEEIPSVVEEIESPNLVEELVNETPKEVQDIDELINTESINEALTEKDVDPIIENIKNKKSTSFFNPDSTIGAGILSLLGFEMSKKAIKETNKDKEEKEAIKNQLNGQTPTVELDDLLKEEKKEDTNLLEKVIEYKEKQNQAPPQKSMLFIEDLASEEEREHIKNIQKIEAEQKEITVDADIEIVEDNLLPPPTFEQPQESEKEEEFEILQSVLNEDAEKKNIADIPVENNLIQKDSYTLDDVLNEKGANPEPTDEQKVDESTEEKGSIADDIPAPFRGERSKLLDALMQENNFGQNEETPIVSEKIEQEIKTPLEDIINADNKELLHKNEDEMPKESQPDTLSRMQNADEYIRQGAYESGIEIYEGILQREPDNNEVRFLLAAALVKKVNNYERATFHLEQLLQRNENDADAYYLLASIAEIHKDYILAKTYYERALSINADYPSIHYRLGMIMINHFPYEKDKALSFFRDAILQNKRHVDSHYQYGILLHEHTNQHEKALKHFKKTLKLNPVHPFAAYDLALLYHRFGDKAQASEYYLAACKNNPELRTPQNDEVFFLKPTEAKQTIIGHKIVETNEPKIVAAPKVVSVPKEVAAPKETKKTYPRVDKIVFITGATSGIGKATAEVFAEAGYRLILSGRRTKRLQQLESDFEKKYDSDVHILPFDVRDAATLNRVIEGMDSEWHNVDLLINNAGLAKGFDPIHEANIEHWETMIDTNIKGLLYMTRAIAPLMVKRGKGHIINVCSTAGHEVYPSGNVYCATKHAVNALTKAMRLDLYKYNIRVSQVSPAHVEETEFALTRFDGDAERAKIYNDFNPLTSKDVAQSIFFIATQPEHVNIQDILIMGTQQANSMNVDKTGRKYD